LIIYKLGNKNFARKTTCILRTQSLVCEMRNILKFKYEMHTVTVRQLELAWKKMWVKKSVKN